MAGAMRRLAFLAVLLLAGCTGPPAPADDDPPAPASLDAWPAWEVGDRWEWSVRSRSSDGRWTTGDVSGEVVEVTNDTYLVRYVNEAGEPGNQTFWRANVSLTSTRTASLVFPLEVNATWNGSASRSAVRDHAEVTVPAGSFDAWRVNHTLGSRTTTGWRDEWWSPEAKVWVKTSQSRLFGGANLVVERELVRYRLADGRSGP